MVGRLLVGFVWLNRQFSVSWQVDFSGVRVAQSSFLCHDWKTFSGVRVAQSLGFCVMVGRPLEGLVWLNLQFSVSWLVDFQWGSCGSIVSFLCHGWQTFSGVRVALQTFNGVRVSQSLFFCVMVGRLLVGFVWLYLQFSVLWQVDFQWGSCGSIQFSVSWQVDFQWGSCGSIFSFLCHGWYTFSGVRVAQSLVFCVMVGRFLVGFVWLCRLLMGFVCLNLYFSVSWLVDFQWGSCGSIFSFLCYGRQTFSGVRVAQSSFLCHGWQTFRGVRVALSLVFCVMVGILLWGSCGSIFSFLCHGWQIFSEVRVAQSLVFCVMVGRLLVGFVWLNLQFFCVMVGRFLVGFVWLNL